jgi:hypothetical protein
MKNNLFSILLLSWATFFWGIVNYFYHPLMLQYLTLEEFWTFESLLWIFSIVSIIILAVSMFLVKEISLQQSISWNIYSALKKYIAIFATIFLLFFLILGLFLNSFLHINNYLYFLLLWASIFFINFELLIFPFLQWLKKFKILSFIWFIIPIIKLIIWFIFVFFWFKIYGALFGFIISQLIFILLWYYFLKKNLLFNNLSNNNNNLEKKIISDFKSQKKQIFQFFLSSIILAILMNIDILFAKHFFEAEIAWTYAGISIIAKFLVFVWMSIETVYYPILTSQKFIDKKKVFLLSSLYVIITLWALWFFYLFWEKILYIFKPWFEQYLDLLYLIIIYCWALSLLNFIVKILVAFDKYFLNYILIFLLIIFIFLLYKFTSSSMYNMVNIFNILIWVNLVSWFLYLWLVKNEK